MSLYNFERISIFASETSQFFTSAFSNLNYYKFKAAIFTYFKSTNPLFMLMQFENYKDYFLLVQFLCLYYLLIRVRTKKNSEIICCFYLSTIIEKVSHFSNDFYYFYFVNLFFFFLQIIRIINKLTLAGRKL